MMTPIERMILQNQAEIMASLIHLEASEEDKSRLREAVEKTVKFIVDQTITGRVQTYGEWDRQ